MLVLNLQISVFHLKYPQKPGISKQQQWKGFKGREMGTGGIKA